MYIGNCMYVCACVSTAQAGVWAAGRRGARIVFLG